MNTAPPRPAPVILVIDDEPIMRDLMGDWLESAGYRVLKAADWHGAVAQLELHRPPVVVTDMFMPGPCCEGVIGRIRQAAPGAAIVAVSGHFKSGYGMSGDCAVAAGADRALAKPVQRSEFLETIAGLLR
jgi:CheY-like chemotaxis protein